MNSTDALTGSAASAAGRISPDSNSLAHLGNRPSRPLVLPETADGAGRDC
ncbi:MAG TPA: hypothetical protein VF376_09725 [Thermoanaerobaculia bacterium]